MKTKDGYIKLIEGKLRGDINSLLLSDGGSIAKSVTSTANSLVLRNASGLIESSVAANISPFNITSTTLNINLNADLLDGKHLSEILASDITGNSAGASKLISNSENTTGVYWYNNFMPFGDTTDGSWCSPTKKYTKDSKEGDYLTILRLRPSNAYYNEISFDSNLQNPHWRLVINGRSYGWKQFAFTDSNVASADKLKEPINLWGQSFDGSSDITGNLTLANDSKIQAYNTAGSIKRLLHLNTDNSFIIGNNSNASYLEGTNLTFRTGTSNLTAMYISNNGFVGIATSNPDSPLTVEGSVNISRGANLNLTAASGTSDPGDIIFKDSSGTEIGRIFKESGYDKFKVRFGNSSVPSYTVMHGGNLLDTILNIDGPGSLIDADLLDGKHASDFSRAFSTEVQLASPNSYTRVCSVTDSKSTGSSILVNVRAHYNSTVHNANFLCTGTFYGNFGIISLSNPQYYSVKIRITSDNEYGKPYYVDIACESLNVNNTPYYVHIIPLHSDCVITKDGTLGVSACTYSHEVTTSKDGGIIAPGYVKSGSDDTYVLLGGGGHKTLQSFDDAYLNSSGDTMNGVLTMSTGTGIAMKYTSNGNDPWIYPNGAVNYGIRYFEGNPDKMAFSATGNNNSISTADLCINGNGEGTVTIRGNSIWHAGNHGTGSGLDADKLDGKDISEVGKYIFGSGTTLIKSTDDLNDLDYGYYRTTDNTSYTNAPRLNFGLLVARLNGDYKGLLLLSYSAGTLRYRSQVHSGGSIIWNDWRTIAYTDSDITGNSAGASNILGGKAGSIVYQSDENKTAFLSAPSTEGQVLKFNTTTKTPYWASDSNSHYTTHLYVGATGEASSKSTTNGNTYIKLYDDNTARESYKIYGSGATLVTSDTSGHIKIHSENTWTAWAGATASAAGTAGYMPAATSAQRNLFLRGDGQWVSLNNYSLPTASDTVLGGVKTGAAISDTAGYTKVHIKDGIIYYKDTNSTNFLKILEYSGNAIDAGFDANLLILDNTLYSSASDLIYWDNLLYDNFPTSKPSGSFILTNLKEGNYLKQIYTCYNSADIYIRYSYYSTKEVWSDWKKLALTSDNVASATKLANSRTLWGLSFNGSSNVSGNIHLGDGGDYEIGTGYASNNTKVYNKIVFGNSSTGLQYHSGSWTSADALIAHTFIVGNTSTNALLINNTGNVTIGTSDTASHIYKLRVSGKSCFDGDFIINEGGKFLRKGEATFTIYSAVASNSSYGNEITCMLSCFDSKDPETSTYPTDYAERTVLALQPRGGRVAIGKLYPGYTLDVNGKFNATTLYQNGTSLSDTYLKLSDYTASSVLSKLTTVDGDGSGLDADLLDGYHASSFPIKGTHFVNSSAKKCTYNTWTRVLKVADGNGWGMRVLVNIQTHHNSTVMCTSFLCTFTYNKLITINELSGNNLAEISIRVGSDSGYGYETYIDIRPKSEYSNGHTYYVSAINLGYTGTSITHLNTTNVSALTYSAERTSTEGGAISSAKFIGDLVGNADTATALGTDAGGSTTPVYFSGGKPVACTSYASASVNYANSAGSAGDSSKLNGLSSSAFLRDVTLNATFSSAANISTSLTAGMHRIHISGKEYSSILTGYDFYGSYWLLYFHPSSGYTEDIKYRATNCSSWKTLLDSNNYNNYSPKLNGTGATGTWGISVSGSSGSCTGNAATATNVAWSGVTSKPTTLSGYGITDNIPGIVFCSAANYIPTTANLNDYTATSKAGLWNSYDNTTYTNGPRQNFGLLVMRLNTSYSGQLCLPYNNGSLRYRSLYHTGTSIAWRDWKTILDSDNYTDYALSKTGTAAAASKLATSVNINGTSFNGTSDITTSKWGTSRSITIGGTAKSVDGSGNVSWSSNEIGYLYKWGNHVKVNTWSRLCFVKYASSVIGCKFLINVSGTRNSVVFNDLYAITAHHSNNGNIIKLCGSHYSTGYKLRILSNSSGSCYVEMYDNLINYDSVTYQYVYCRLIPIFTGDITIYESYTAGSIPSGYSEISLTLNSYQIQGSINASATDGYSISVGTAGTDSSTIYFVT